MMKVDGTPTAMKMTWMQIFVLPMTRLDQPGHGHDYPTAHKCRQLSAGNLAHEQNASLRTAVAPCVEETSDSIFRLWHLRQKS
jgi:hypothetical protein